MGLAGTIAAAWPSAVADPAVSLQIGGTLGDLVLARAVIPLAGLLAVAALIDGAAHRSGRNALVGSRGRDHLALLALAAFGVAVAFLNPTLSRGTGVLATAALAVALAVDYVA